MAAGKRAHWFNFGGAITYDYGIIADASETLVKPVREMEHVSIPGRSGDLTIDNGRWSNVTVTYHCYCKRALSSNFTNFLAVLHSKGGIQKLQDSRMSGLFSNLSVPGCYRMGSLEAAVKAENVYLSEHCEFDITFNCKPQLWLNAGDVGVKINREGEVNYKYIKNPTEFPSKPLVRCYGKGTGSTDATMAKFTVNGRTIMIANYNNTGGTYVEVDCDICDCFYGAINMNAYMKMQNTDGKFPELGTSLGGSYCYAYTSSGADSMIITPRWWTI